MIEILEAVKDELGSSGDGKHRLGHLWFSGAEIQEALEECMKIAIEHSTKSKQRYLNC